MIAENPHFFFFYSLMKWRLYFWNSWCVFQILIISTGLCCSIQHKIKSAKVTLVQTTYVEGNIASLRLLLLAAPWVLCFAFPLCRRQCPRAVLPVVFYHHSFPHPYRLYGVLRIKDKDILVSIDTYKLLRWKRPSFTLVSQTFCEH